MISVLRPRFEATKLGSIPSTLPIKEESEGVAMPLEPDGFVGLFHGKPLISIVPRLPDKFAHHAFDRPGHHDVLKECQIGGEAR